MDSGMIWRLVLVAVIAYFAIKLILWLLSWVVGVIQIGLVLAVVVGVVWLLIQIFGRKKAYM